MQSRTSSEREPPYTWADFVALPEDDSRELIDGCLVEVEVPTKLHEHVVACLVYAIGAWARAHGSGHVIASGYRVRIDKDRGVLPDVQYYTRDAWRAAPNDGLVEGHPDLAVEVVSPTSGAHDRVRKLGYYATIGTPEYWVVDPQERTLQRFVLRGAAYVLAAALSDDALFEPESFPGLSIALRDLWDVDA